jgi:hypothetical protein
MSKNMLVLAFLVLGVHGAPVRPATESTTTTTLSESRDDASTAAASHETLLTVSKTQNSSTATSTTTETPAPTIARVRPEWVEDYEARFGRGALRDRWKTMTLPPWAPLLTDPRYHNTRINSDFYDGPMTDYTPWEQTHTPITDKEEFLKTIVTKKYGVLKPPIIELEFRPGNIYIPWPDWYDPYQQLYGEKNFPGRIQPHESDYHTDMFDPWGLLGVGIRSTTTSMTSANTTSSAAPETTALTSKGDAPEGLSARDVPGRSTEVGNGNTNVTVDGDVRDLMNSRANIGSNTNDTVDGEIRDLVNSRVNVGSNTNETVDGETRDRLNSFVIVSGKTDPAIDTEIRDLVNSLTNVGPNGEANVTVDRETRDRLNTFVIVSGKADPAIDSEIRGLVNGRTIVGPNGEANMTVDGEVRDIVNRRINVSINGTTNATVGEAVRDLLNFFVIVPGTGGGSSVDAQPHEKDADSQDKESGKAVRNDTPIQKPGQMTPEQIKSALERWDAQANIWAHQKADQQLGEGEAVDTEGSGIVDEGIPSFDVQGVTIIHTTLETKTWVRGGSTSTGAIQTTAWGVSFHT